MSEQKQDQILDHEYDGIEEYDNRLPNWWLYILYGSIIFAIGYWIFYHTFGVGKLPPERYQVEMVDAAEAMLAQTGGEELSNESMALMATIPDRVKEGRGIFEQFCVVCHLEQGQGAVGPNLTDAYWLHGPRPMDLHNVVTNGVLEKGMAAWGGQLGPRRVENVVAYVLSIRNTNVSGKEPQGKHESEWEEESAGSPEASADTTVTGDS